MAHFRIDQNGNDVYITDMDAYKDSYTPEEKAALREGYKKTTESRRPKGIVLIILHVVIKILCVFLMMNCGGNALGYLFFLFAPFVFLWIGVHFLLEYPASKGKSFIIAFLINLFV